MRFKTDSFVVESNVHFPTDYNLLWDCARKSLDSVSFFVAKYRLNSWRKMPYWYKTLKNLCRSIGKISGSGGQNKQERLKEETRVYLHQAVLLLEKIEFGKKQLPVLDLEDLVYLLALDKYILLLKKHIDLVERRILKGEVIAHKEKMFSIFETYTEWINKGKSNPSVELGKKVAITTDQHHLIVDYVIMENENDKDITIKVADTLLSKYKAIQSWSFDKGFWDKSTKELLATEIDHVIMPKKGTLNSEEKLFESSYSFKNLRHAHSAVESNINELEHRGLNRCPDRGYAHFKSYVGAAICSYNLKKIGRKILEDQRKLLNLQVA